MIGIYKITNIITNKVYIGQSRDMTKRWSRHRRFLQSNDVLTFKSKLYNSIKKYGIENHKFEVVLKCNIEDLNYYERCFQEIYNTVECGLNCTYTATETKPKVYSEEERLKMSNRMKEFYKNGWVHPMTGRKMSDETKEILRQKNLGKKQSKETIEKRKLTRLKRKKNII